MNTTFGDLKIGVIGLGYVGLPIAVEFAKKYKVFGLDINENKIGLLKNGTDPSKEISNQKLSEVSIHFTSKSAELADCNVYIVTVPTPVDDNKNPNLKPLKSACYSLAKIIKKGDYIIFESTVFPGCTEEICIPIIEQGSNLTYKSDFKVGYSPERINPGDKVHTLTNITKVVSACDSKSLEFIAQLYGSIIDAGIYKAESIKVAEAAKIIENTQRDVNIALMNELAIIFDKMDINTRQVLNAAGTKWNFLNFFPGLVGGHCIGVDPYYLKYKAEQLGYKPEIISNSRIVNDGIVLTVIDKINRKLFDVNKASNDCTVLIQGFTYKENISDIRNTRVVDLYHSLLKTFKTVDIFDPIVNKNEVKSTYDIEVKGEVDMQYDIMIIAVPHRIFEDVNKRANISKILAPDAIIFDVKSSYLNSVISEDFHYLSL